VASALCAVALLTACGQKGNLYMPNDPEFKQRATLPDIVRRQFPSETAAPTAASPTSAASAPLTAPRKPTAPAAQSPANAASAAGR
jgi:hypothetical protein